MAEDKGEVVGERAPQWAEPSVDEAQKMWIEPKQSHEVVVEMYFLRYTHWPLDRSSNFIENDQKHE